MARINNSGSSELSKERLVIISYNLHGFNQGVTGLQNLIQTLCPDVIMVQEHWLSAANFSNLYKVSDNYFVFGSSAMEDRLAAGPLIGRPFGGTAMLINKKHAKATVTLYTAERYCIISVADWLLVNVYMPCCGVKDRNIIYTDLLHDLAGILQIHSNKNWLIGGDLNTDLNNNDLISTAVNDFIGAHNLSRLDVAYPVSCRCTYFSESLNAQSCLDYFFTNNIDCTAGYNILDLEINLSDHLPILAVCKYPGSIKCPNSEPATNITFLRWDHAPLGQYYELTRVCLQPILDELNDMLKCVIMLSTSDIDRLYCAVVAALKYSAGQCIPQRTKNFYKFWWNEELAELKRLAIASANTWKDAGKPKSGPIFSNYNKDKLRYKQAISKERVRERDVFTNELHDALLRKSSKDFWKSWKSKFPSKLSNTINVDGLVDEIEIVKHFAAHFEQVCTPHSSVRNKKLQSQYLVTRGNYLGDSLRDSHMFDVGLLSKLAMEMGTGKAAGMDGLTAEHLKNSHPIIFTILCKLFNQCLFTGWVPPAFSVSYTVPVPKGDAGSQSLSALNFRGISINCILSKLFEMAILSRFSPYFETSDLQFGFKQKLSCSHAIIL